MRYKDILDNKRDLSVAILKEMYPDGFTDLNREEKSLKDIEWTISFLVEAMKVDSPRILENYFIWLGGLFDSLNIDLIHIDLLFDKLGSFLSNKYGKFIKDFLDKVNYKREDTGILLGEDNPFYSEMMQYTLHVLDAKKQEATKIVHNMLDKGISIDDIYIYIFQESLRLIGSYWQSGKISVAKEHYFTAVTQFIMSTLYPYVFSSETTNKRMIAGSIGSELHEVGIRMVADIFEMRGWDTVYLGSNVPVIDLIDYAKQYQPNIIALSITMPYHVGLLQDAITEIRKVDELKNTFIMVGGLPFVENPELSTKLGADACAKDAISGVEKANELLQ